MLGRVLFFSFPVFLGRKKTLESLEPLLVVDAVGQCFGDGVDPDIDNILPIRVAALLLLKIL